MLKFLKHSLIGIFTILTIGFLIKGWLYRKLVSYKNIGVRKEYIITNKKLKLYIDKKVENFKPKDISDIMNISLRITTDCLTFKVGRNDNDPNKLIGSTNAHCVGYSAFFSTTCNYLLQKYDYSVDWVSKSLIGQIYICGTNIHPYVNSSFLKDHDFNIIVNTKTGQKYLVDPSVYEYFGINFITENK